MSAKLAISEQVTFYVRRLPPEPRKRVRKALRELQKLKGDIRLLNDKLDGYSRLRVGEYRVIFWMIRECIYCEFIERRAIVYEVFEKTLLDD